jgi:hypothetical protein
MTSAGVEQPGVPAKDENLPADDGATILEAPKLLRIMWADPQHSAEHLAVWSLARFGRRAQSQVAKLRSRDPVPSRDELEQLIVQRQTRVTMTEGAFVGGPFIVLIAVAFCAALLAQAQMVFELAAARDRSPVDRLRAAELLVLLGAYSTTNEAMQALAELPADPGSRVGKRFPAGSRMAALKRMAYLLQIIGPSVERSRLRAIAGWTGVSVLFLVGLVLPLVWVPYMAYWMRKSTLGLGTRARGYYSESGPADDGVAVVRGGGVRVGGVVAFGRVLLVALFPLLVAVVGLLTGFSLFGGHWLTALVLLLAVSAAATFGWLAYQRRRARRGQAG